MFVRRDFIKGILGLVGISPIAKLLPVWEAAQDATVRPEHMALENKARVVEVVPTPEWNQTPVVHEEQWCRVIFSNGDIFEFPAQLIDDVETFINRLQLDAKKFEIIIGERT